jgi:hypothetical protein
VRQWALSLFFASGISMREIVEKFGMPTGQIKIAPCAYVPDRCVSIAILPAMFFFFALGFSQRRPNMSFLGVRRVSG